MLIRLAVIFLFTFLCASPLMGFEIALKPDVLRQGDILTIRVKGAAGNIQGSFMDKSLYFFRTAGYDFTALAGIDIKANSGEYPLTIICNDKRVVKIVKILPGDFAVQRLTLPKKMVDLDPETLKRVEIEQARLSHLWHVFNEKLWDGRFIMPLNNVITTPFGVRRIINEQERNPHNGIDIKANVGDPIIAPNSGRVALIDDQFFGGKTVILDHGYGIYGVFFHLSKIAVSEGQVVNKGDIIGYAGATGRATGPHLHWGVRFQEERINPLSLINMEID